MGLTGREGVNIFADDITRDNNALKELNELEDFDKVIKDFENGILTDELTDEHKKAIDSIKRLQLLSDVEVCDKTLVEFEDGSKQTITTNKRNLPITSYQLKRLLK